jgi:hypothetical protein
MRRVWKGILIGFAAAAAVAGQTSAAHAQAACGNPDNTGSPAVNDVILIVRAQSDGALQASMCDGAGYGQCANVNSSDPVNTGVPVIDIGDAVQLLREISLLPSCLPSLCAPQQLLAGCPGTVTLPTSINTNLIVPAGCDVRIDGLTFVEPGNTLTIRPGATLKGNVGTPQPSTLIIKKGAKINAVANTGAPITFTSAAAIPASEDWGGIVILGDAPVNTVNGTTTVEGLPPSPETECGGSDVNDNSGCLKFVRIYFSGRDLTPNNELNLLVFCAVGRATQVDHVQVHVGADDGFEWFGGTVNTKFMVASALGDDGFDSQLGTTGALQFGLIAQRSNIVEADSHGWEMDGSEFGFDDQPISNPKFCNVTALGLKGQAVPANTNQIGVRTRRGNAVQIANSIVSGFSQGANGGGLSIQDPETSGHMCRALCVGGADDGKLCRRGSCEAPGVCTFQNANQSLALPGAGLDLTGDAWYVAANGGPAPPGPLGFVRNSLFFNNGAAGTAHGFNVSACDAAGECACTSTAYMTFIDASNDVDTAAADPMNIGGGVFPPTNLVPALGSLADTHPTADCTAIDGSFELTDYVGAFQPGGADWTAGWTSFP